MAKKEKKDKDANQIFRTVEVQSPIVLGKQYKDCVTGLSGTAVVFAVHLTGCNRVALEYGNNGTPADIWVDESRLIDCETGEMVFPVDQEDQKPEPGPGPDQKLHHKRTDRKIR